MPTPANKIATDQEIIEAIKNHDSYGEAARSLGMAVRTVYNRVNLMKQKQPAEVRPDNYKHDPSFKRFFVSCVVSGAPLHKKGFKSVQTMCDHLGAEQVYIPVQYDWQDVKSGKHEPTYPKQVMDKLLSSDVELNKHLNLMGSVPVHATIQNPLSGLKHTSKNKSAIYGHPQMAMESVATHKSKLPKLLYTTGAMTEPRYTRSKAGRKAQDCHNVGGLIIEVSKDRFHIFEINVDSNGSFYHLDHFYNGDSVSDSNVTAVYMADEHAEGYEKSVGDATYWNKDSIVNALNPEYVVRGDVYNHGSDSHHGRNDVFNKITRYMNDADCVKKELDDCFDHIRATTVGDYQNVIVASNHHDHLKRWLNEFSPHTGNPKNILLYHQLNAALIEEMINEGVQVDPFEMYGRKWHPDIYSQCVFLSRDEEFDINGVDCSRHGDIGPNGARGSAVNLSLMGKPTIIGHGHSPKRHRNVHQVGVGAEELGYNKGPSGWMASHAAVYPNGTVTMLHIINGKWRL